ncbi:SICA antigen [Plasmodium coatneyi]|uniref:SICA antigen n=1 Tax=Plasmodium coatneyi TaxID=208452 RepID=A0A1B1E3X1_9APIC|nr:SICA antigen [Plasmodium coatneyi]ANQ09708.1 SICA antigen [Plasmodium coatneyi]
MLFVKKNIWDYGDMENILKNLSTAMKSGNAEGEDLCRNFNGGDEAKKEANKKACKFIVKGLKHIDNLRGDIINKKPQHKENDKIFEQTMACLILNEYGKLLQEKCSAVKDAVEQAFTAAGSLHGTECKGGKCIPCEWDECRNFIIGGNDNQRKRIKKELEKNKDITDTLDKICPEDEQSKGPKPVVTPAVHVPAGTGGHGSKDPTSKRAKDKSAPPAPVPLVHKIDPSDLLPYLPLAPVLMGTSVMSYLLWNYFAQEQLPDHVDDQDDDPHEYTLVKERKQPRSTPQKRGKQVGKRAGRRMIIDIHLEVLNECQKGDTQLDQEDFFEILVQEFMGSEFMEDKNVPKEKVPSSDSGFREERLCS